MEATSSNLTREVEQKALLGRKKARTLSCQVAWSGDGTTAERNTLHKIRQDLHLDEEHGYDSKTFYEATGSVPDDFVQSYRTVLRRLARL